MPEKSTLKWGPKRLLNRRKVAKTEAFMGIGRKWMALEIPRIVTRKTLINGGLKIQNMTGVHLRFVMGS
jgi:hypothetical protein